MEGKFLFLVLIVSLMMNSVSFGQTNLVQNGSFEQFSHCITGNCEVDSCIGWHAIMNTPDYYNSCTSLFDATVPHNQCGYQVPFEGNAYLGLYTYLEWVYYREVVGSQLLDTMIPGNHYHVSMRVSAGFDSVMFYVTACSNKLGMRFTTYPYSMIDTPSINNYAQLYEDTVIQSHDSINWVLLAWDYIPDSAYTYVSIGNFFTDPMTTYIPDSGLAPGPYAQAYYYIDSVNIVCSDGNCLTGISSNETHDVNLNYDFMNSTIYVHDNMDGYGTLCIINLLGQTIEKLEINNDQKISLSNLNEGFYIAIFNSEKLILTKKIIIK